MRIRVLLAVVSLAAGGVAVAQEYRIADPASASSTPVHLTEPVSGQVEVLNLPPVQSVQIVGGTLEQPVEVQGVVGLRLDGPLPVEVVNPPESLGAVQIDGLVSVTSDQPLRVWVENPPPPPTPPASPPDRYVGFAFRGVFQAEQSVLRQTFSPGVGEVFRLTDLILDTRPDVILWVRVLAAADALAGAVAGAGEGELALLVLDPRSGPAARPGTPVPLRGPFVIEVEAVGPGQGAPFRVLASGTLHTVSGAPVPPR